MFKLRPVAEKDWATKHKQKEKEEVASKE